MRQWRFLYDVSIHKTTRTATIRTYNSNFGTWIERQVDVFENGFGLVGKNFGKSDEGKHELARLGVEPSILYRLLLLRRLPLGSSRTLTLGLFAVEGRRT